MNFNSEKEREMIMEGLLDEGVVSWIKQKAEDLKNKAIALKKGGVREGYETVLAARILVNIIKKKGASPDEVKFLKSQSADIAKVVGLLGLQAIPGNNLVVLFLDKLFKKYNIPFTFYPSSHTKPENQEFLKNAFPERDLSEMKQSKIDRIIQEEMSKVAFEIYVGASIWDKQNFLSEGMEEDMMNALTDICVLTFSSENSKLGGSVSTFSLPAGWTCPFADACLKKVDRDRVMDPKKKGTFKTSAKTGEKIPYKGDVVVTKGEDAKFDCYAANQEMQYDAVRSNRWHNYDLLKEAGKEGGVSAQADLIKRSLEHHFDQNGKTKTVRIHESGDFYNGEYMKAWMEVAKKMPGVHFYAYTKSVPFVKKNKEELDSIPNISLTLSIGGKRDRDISSLDVKQAEVFNSPEDVLEAGLMIDLDDDLAKEKGGKEKNFALLIHGTQKKGEMSQHKMRNETFMAYWKYRKKLNRSFGKEESHIWSEEEADAGLNVINKLLPKKGEEKEGAKKKGKFSKTELEFLKKLLNYVKKYNSKYDFSEELVNIIQPKYR